MSDTTLQGPRVLRAVQAGVHPRETGIRKDRHPFEEQETKTPNKHVVNTTHDAQTTPFLLKGQTTEHEAPNQNQSLHKVLNTMDTCSTGGVYN
ncbi:Hypothetical protein SMAX5B_012129 [Scophthalmus maximus]|uniref:Uncharacterized protein n=1 Tax=Scophthalmus maximus TaxID=52904 RepID=A0A2U9AZ69_SCOMX|nr:Hypothetical protein SMAX5B_012129 [Scophthalmus maximus]AWO96931.1 Hypothetical protein SMAX5B_012129 [Scophthalmus maximus]